MKATLRARSVIVLVAALVTCAATARLGWWQLDRAAQKTALQAQLDTRAALPSIETPALATSPQEAAGQHDRPARLRGHWVAQATVFLDNRQMAGRPGFLVITPLRLTGRDDAVLVQRGWAPRHFDERSALPQVTTPAGEVEVIGRMAPPPGRLYEFAGAGSGPIRQNLDLAGFSAETGLRLAPVSVLQQDASPPVDDGLLRQWPHPAVNVQMHYGYAVQWFALSALVAGLYVWFQLVRPRLRRSA